MPGLQSFYMSQTKTSTPFALLINDIHVSSNTLDNFRRNWEEALEICKGYHINHIIIGGDLWTSRASQTLDVLMAVDAALTQASASNITVDIADGNHDKVDQESYVSYNRLFRHIPNVGHIQRAKGYDLDGVTLLVMSYFPENTTFTQELNAALDMLYGVEKKDIILYMHEGINGALGSSNGNELPASMFSGFRQVLVGHYHDRNRVADNIMYIGSSRQHNFGEDEEKGYTILYTDGSTRFIENQANFRYCTIEISPDEIKDVKGDIGALIAEAYKVKVKVVGDSTSLRTVDRKCLVDMGVTKVEVVAETEVTESHNADFSTKYDKSGLKEEYKTFCSQKEITDIQTGIKYLDKIN